MLADAEHLEAEPVGELDLLEQVVHPFCRRHLSPRLRIRRQLAEGVDAELQVPGSEVWRDVR